MSARFQKKSQFFPIYQTSSQEESKEEQNDQDRECFKYLESSDNDDINAKQILENEIKKCLNFYQKQQLQVQFEQKYQKKIFDSSEFFPEKEKLQKQKQLTMEEERMKQSDQAEIEVQQQADYCQIRYQLVKRDPLKVHQNTKKEFDSADFFMQQDQKYNNQNDKIELKKQKKQDQIEEVIEKQSNELEKTYILNKKNILDNSVKIKKKEFDSADYFLEKEMNSKISTDSLKSLNQNQKKLSTSDKNNYHDQLYEELESEQSEQCQIQYALKKQDNISILQEKRQKKCFDSADYFLKQSQQQQQQIALSQQQQKENESKIIQE